MSAAYIVIQSGYTVGVNVVGAYSGFQAASEKASEIAQRVATEYDVNNLILFIKEPKEEKLPDGSVEWVFMRSPHTVLVSFRQIETPARKQLIVVEPKDDPARSDLPAGWDRSGLPITVEDLLYNPVYVKEYDSLSDKEILALVTARIRKRPNFVLNIPGWGIYNRDEALGELKKLSHIGEMIIESEIYVLNNLLFESLKSM